MTRVQGAASAAPVLALLFNAFTWGVSWWPFRHLQAQGVHPLWATALCYLLVSAVLGLRRPAALLDVLRTPALWVLVFASGCTNAAFNWGVTTGDVVRVVLLFYLMPLWTLLLARWLLHEPLHGGVLLRAALALGGALVVLWPAEGGWPVPQQKSDWLGLIGGVAFALNNVILRRESHRDADARALAMFSGGAVIGGTAALLGAAAGVAPPPWHSAAAWGAPVVLLALWFMGSNLALQFGAARLRASTTAVVMVSEVLFASVSAAWLGAATLTVATLAGGGLIAAAALLAAWQERRS
ncbi:MAG: DMT family transporter [Burkholderiaceae bacterium]|nr:DMT family transporter [Burkholderiaceae bacterium]